MNKKKIQNPETVIQGVIRNDHLVLKELYEENYGKTRNYVLQNSGTEEQAKDVYQEAFIAFWKNARQGRIKTDVAGSVEGYIFSIAKNKWLDQLRMGRTQKHSKIIRLQTEEVSEPFPLENDLQKEEKIQKAMQAVEHLGQECKDLLIQFYFDKKSLRAIADSFGINENSARNKKYRCMQYLKELLATLD